jgi:hypothetical protein
LAYKQLTYSILIDLQNQPNATSTPYFTNRLIGGGYAIFPLSSLLNHSCEPNLLPRYTNTTLFLSLSHTHTHTITHNECE